MSRYQPYPAYKDSGVQWIGPVPKHWAVRRLKHVAAFATSTVDKKACGGQDAVRLCNYTDVYNAEFIRPSMAFMEATASKTEIARFTLQRGDVLMTKDSEDPADIGVAALVPEDMPGVVCGYHLAIVRPAHFETSCVVQRTLGAHPTKAYFFVEAPGLTRYGLSQDAIGNTPICVPPPQEQSVIAPAIDRETAHIDSLIAKKTRFIELLREKRQAFITHAVTKGLDPSVRMRDSGVEWIGDVPAHWRLPQLGKVACDRCDGPFGSGLKTAHYVDAGVRVVRLQNIGSGTFNDADAAYISEQHWVAALGRGHDVLPGDVLIAGLGDNNNPLGRACVAPVGLGDAMVKADCYRFRLGPDAAPVFISHALSATARAECGFLATGATRDRLTLGLAASRRIPLPPMTEQRAICAAIDYETVRIDKLVALTERSIALLKERRAAFITAAVTGQIDLRDAAPSPEEAAHAAATTTD